MLSEATTERFDAVVTVYVLNVVPPAEQQAILNDMAALLAPGGTAFAAVRRDVKAGKRGAGAWQWNVRILAPNIHSGQGFDLYAFQRARALPGSTIGLRARTAQEPWRTAIVRTAPSVPMRILHGSRLLEGRVLDYGCGHGFDADAFGLWSWDPHHRKELTPPCDR